MIHMPRRSVTRFFVPMVDVLLLLFSMYLLMPVLQGGGRLDAGATGDLSLAELIADHKRLKDDKVAADNRLRELQKYQMSQAEADKLRADIARLQRDKINVLKTRLDIRVLEVDPADGKLVFYDRRRQPPVKIIVADELEARRLIRQHKEEAGEAGLELYYLVLFPRVDSAFPEERQFREYERWLGDVAYGVDRPTYAAAK